MRRFLSAPAHLRLPAASAGVDRRLPRLNPPGVWSHNIRLATQGLLGATGGIGSCAVETTGSLVGRSFLSRKVRGTALCRMLKSSFLLWARR